MYDKPLATDKHEAFAQAVVRLNNYAKAWREVYDPEGKDVPRTSWTEGCRLANSLHVGRRIEWLRAQLLERTQISVAGLMQDLYDIATADPRELCRVVTGNCRHCHGEGFKYQWRDPDEFAAACERVEAANTAVDAKRRAPLPTCDGGFGFDVLREPHPMCPECMGVGVRNEYVADMSNLSEKARKLYTGQLDKFGRPVLHDQLAARDQLHKLAGAYKTNSDGQSLALPAPTTADGKPSGDASVTYLAMVHGGRKSA